MPWEPPAPVVCGWEGKTQIKDVRVWITLWKAVIEVYTSPRMKAGHRLLGEYVSEGWAFMSHCAVEIQTHLSHEECDGNTGNDQEIVWDKLL